MQNPIPTTTITTVIAEMLEEPAVLAAAIANPAYSELDVDVRVRYQERLAAA